MSRQNRQQKSNSTLTVTLRWKALLAWRVTPESALSVKLDGKMHFAFNIFFFLPADAYQA